MKTLMKLMMLVAIFAVVSCSGKKEATEEAVAEVEEVMDDAADAVTDAADAASDAASDATDAVDNANSGQTYTTLDGMVVYNFAEVAPSFTYKKANGPEAIVKYLSANVKYPEEAKNNGAEGKVIVQFVVATDGTVKDVEVVRGNDEESLNEEAVRVVSEMPNWVAGQQDGENVNVKYTQPITFKLH